MSGQEISALFQLLSSTLVSGSISPLLIFKGLDNRALIPERKVHYPQQKLPLLPC